MSSVTRYLTKGVGVALTAVHTTPAAGSFHVVGSWIIANTSSAAVSVTASIQNGGVDYYQVVSFTLQAGDTLFLHGLLGKTVLQNGDVLRVQSSVAASLDVTVSVAVEP
jgi:hypothetical protein